MKALFEAVPNDWPVLLLDSVAKRGSGHTPNKSQPAYWTGGIKWVSLADSNKLDRGLLRATEREISEEGMRRSSAVLHPAGTVVLSRDAGIGKSAVLETPMTVSQHFIAWDCSGSSKLYNWFLYHLLQMWKPEFDRVAVGSSVKTIGLPYFKKMKVPCPPLEEQKRIADILATWDRALAVSEKLLANRRKQKQVLTHQLLSGKRRLRRFTHSATRVPTRFGSVPADWPHVPIEEVADEISVRNEDTKPLPVLSCTKHDGLVDSTSYFRKRVHSEDTSAYKVVERGCFAYATNHIDEGSIGCQTLYDSALISPMYTVFKVSEKLDDSFLYKVLKTEHYRQIFSANTNASVDRRGSLRWRDFEKIEIPVPAIEEQKAISDIINTAELEIKNLERQLAALREQKKVLMAQLLMGKRRVRVPEPPEQAVA